MPVEAPRNQNLENLRHEKIDGRSETCATVVDYLPEGMPKHEFLQGTLDMMILRTLQWGPQHGHGIGQAIRLKSDDVLQIDHGSLYPALHRLEGQGWISAEWKQSEANRRAKYYKLTPSGKRQLAREESRWAAVVKTVARVMRPSEGR